MAQQAEEPPQLAVVECDGGRVRTREPGQGPGVHLVAEGWRETKNAVLIRATRQVFAEDPQPEPPACFCDAQHVAKIVGGEKSAPGHSSSPPEQPVLSYLYGSAKAVHSQAKEAWEQYRVWMRGCWQGEVDQVLYELSLWQQRLDPPPAEAAEQDPRRVVAKTLSYLQHNRGRMDYPSYRRQGRPVTSAWMESLVKEMNYRVKGSEMFWNDPEGAEAILQVRAAALCDDGRLVSHLKTRPGYAFVRRPKIRILPAQTRKS
ncbi:MAG: hypothetical protein K6T86_11575 [Pirellulales bacterium]|nr:hypothetical protein [Pirellulales bacterium]